MSLMNINVTDKQMQFYAGVIDTGVKLTLGVIDTGVKLDPRRHWRWWQVYFRCHLINVDLNDTSGKFALVVDDANGQFAAASAVDLELWCSCDFLGIYAMALMQFRGPGGR